MSTADGSVLHKRSKLKKSRNGQKILVGITFLIIPLVLLFIFTYLPFFKMFQFSFFDMTYTSKRVFAGFENYIEVFKRAEIFGSLKLSLYYMAGALIQLAVALFFATLLSFKIKGSPFFKGAIFFPFLVCGIAVGFVFKFFFTPGFVLDTMLSWIGFDMTRLPYWLQNVKTNNIALVCTSIWRYLGQNMVLFIGAIMSVDPNMYEAAEIDGANQWHKFFYIILPSIKTIVLLNLILSISGSLSAFEAPFVITKGSFGTATFFVMMDRIAHQSQKVGLASAMAVVLLIIILLVTIGLRLFFRYAFNEGDDGSGMSKRSLKSSEKHKVTSRKGAKI